MTEIYIESVDEPFSHSPHLTRLAFGLVARAQVMSCMPAGVGGVIHLSRPLLEDVRTCFRTAGIGAMPVVRLPDADEDEIAEVLGGTLAAVDASPYPAGEWQPARDLLDDDLLSRLLDISDSSVRRYAGGSRETPDDVAWRLHVVARVLASLLGSYNEYGVRRWFERPRLALEGRTPADVLRSAEHEEDPGLTRVLELAGALEGAASAT
jgi:Protein of unknown function (DUF2384)